jgi:Glycosyl transferase family 11
MMYLLGVQGQLCNQLFRLAHHVANSVQYGYRLSCPVFPYRAYFPNLNAQPLISVKKNKADWQRKLTKLISKLVCNAKTQKLIKNLGIHVLDDPYYFIDTDVKFIQMAKKQPVLVTTWLFRDYINFELKADSIRHLFEPAFEYRREANEILLSIKQPNKVVVGIHIRRGDYKEWEEGRYYYDDTVYYKLIQYLLTLPELSEAVFCLCSNEPLDKNAYHGLPIVESVNNHFMTDLTLLSYCDYLLGPPSTFSAWASFMGQVPLYHMLAATDQPNLSDFAVAAG